MKFSSKMCKVMPVRTNNLIFFFKLGVFVDPRMTMSSDGMDCVKSKVYELRYFYQRAKSETSSGKLGTVLVISVQEG